MFALCAILGLQIGCTEQTPDRNADATKEQLPSPALDYRGVTVVGNNLSRAELLNGVLAANSAELFGVAPSGHISLNLKETSTAHLLSEVLAGVPYAAEYKTAENHEAQEKQTARLTRLYVGMAALARREAEQGTVLTTEATQDQLAADSLFTTSDKQAQLNLLRELDLRNDERSRADMLQALSSNVPEVVEESLRSVEYWRDPTTLSHVEVLIDHPNDSVRRRAKRIVEDLRRLVEDPPSAASGYGAQMSSGEWSTAIDLKAETDAQLPKSSHDR